MNRRPVSLADPDYRKMLFGFSTRFGTPPENIRSYTVRHWQPLFILICINPRAFARAFGPNRFAELRLNRRPSRAHLDLARIAPPPYVRDDDGASPVEEEQRKGRCHQHGLP